MARAAALAHGFVIMESDLPETVRNHRGLQPPQRRVASPSDAATPGQTLRARVASLEQTEAHRALQQTGGNQRRAAELLGLPLRTFERRLRAWRAQPGHARVAEVRAGSGRVERASGSALLREPMHDE
jgi:DNA-binding NtrC family response regulator